MRGEAKTYFLIKRRRLGTQDMEERDRDGDRIRTMVCKLRKTGGCPKLKEVGSNWLRPRREPSVVDLT